MLLCVMSSWKLFLATANVAYNVSNICDIFLLRIESDPYLLLLQYHYVSYKIIYGYYHRAR